MNWFEVALTSKNGDLYLSSNREFILAYQLDEDDKTIFFSIVGLLYDNIYKYKNMQDNIYDGYKLNVTYKKVKKEDYPNIILAPEVTIASDEDYKPIGRKKYYFKKNKNKYFITADDLEYDKLYISQTGMLVKRYHKEQPDYCVPGVYDLVGTVSVNINKCDKELVYDWFGYHMYDLVFEECDEEKWNKHYKFYYKDSSFE